MVIFTTTRLRTRFEDDDGFDKPSQKVAPYIFVSALPVLLPPFVWFRFWLPEPHSFSDDRVREEFFEDPSKCSGGQDVGERQGLLNEAETADGTRPEELREEKRLEWGVRDVCELARARKKKGGITDDIDHDT